MNQRRSTRAFLPDDPAAFDPADWERIQPWYRQLLERELPDTEAMERWLIDFSELTSALEEYAARVRIDKARYTDDPAVEQRFLRYVEQVVPHLSPADFQLQNKLLALDGCADLEVRDQKYAVLLRAWRAEVSVFREANVPIETALTKLSAEYDALIGAMTIDHNGQTYTLPRAFKFQESPVRAERETTWRLVVERRSRDREAIESIFEKMLAHRAELAANAECPDYRALIWTQRQRFDYAPAACDEFADAVERCVVPLVAELDDRRRANLGIDRLRPWDMAVDEHDRGPLTPFQSVDDLLRGTQTIFDRIGAPLGTAFATLEPGRNLDLESRKGKRAGGFQSALTESGEPFIFMNAAGLQRDVDTLLHEGGHAFHFLWACAAEPLLFVQRAPLEFCEVASMSMELISTRFMDVFYDDAAAAGRAVRAQFEGVLRGFVWIAIIDQYQHWLYTNAGHSRAQREAAWLEISNRFTTGRVDWSGLEEYRASAWQRQLHVFHYPFYYIEYGIAQLGALALWRQYQDDPEQTIQRYRHALSLGGTRTLPELFGAAGLQFDFSERTLAPLVESLADRLRTLPS